MHSPIIVTKIKTHNGVSLTVKSWAKEIMTSNRCNARVKRVDFDQVFTTIALGDDYVSICETICDLEDENPEVSRSAIFYFTADLGIVVKALGCSEDDKQRLMTEVMETRKQVIRQKQVEA